MIQARGTRADGSPIYIFGLSAENVKRLQDGKPINFTLDKLGGVGEVIILFGQTEDLLAAELADFIGPDTEVKGGGV